MRSDVVSPASQYLEAVLLGVLQGIAEFLPVSSSGHLVLARAVLDAATGREFDPEGNRLLVVVLHLGTLGSILWAYRKELWETVANPRYVACIVLSTLPLVAIALTPLKDRLNESFNRPDVAAFCLLLTAALLLAGQWLANRRTELAAAVRSEGEAPSKDVGLPTAVAIGLFQAFALLPGMSRSGSTIAGGLMCGMGREEAVRFSLMIGVPAIAGAGTLEARDLVESGVSLGTLPIGPLLLGAAVSFVVGVAAISLLRRAVSNDRLHWFAAYCATVGAAALIWQLL